MSINFALFFFVFFFFFFTDPATTEIYTLSLHDALPIFLPGPGDVHQRNAESHVDPSRWARLEDRKSTRLNSSHQIISYAVFCLKKKNKHLDANHIPCLQPPEIPIETPPHRPIDGDDVCR